MPAPLFRTIRPSTLRHQVVDEIRDAIVSGRLKPGEHLKESTIAEQMAISRSPVREALRLLEQEGLTISIPNRGSFVKDFDEKDVREIFSVRGALESLAVELIVKSEALHLADFERLQAYIGRQKEAIEVHDFDRLAELDLEFHELICRKAESERLLGMWRSLRGQCQVLFHKRFRAMPDYVPSTVITDHSAILDALRQGDAELASQLNKEINERAAEECIQILRSKGMDGVATAQTGGRDVVHSSRAHTPWKKL